MCCSSPSTHPREFSTHLSASSNPAPAHSLREPRPRRPSPSQDATNKLLVTLIESMQADLGAPTRPAVHAVYRVLRATRLRASPRQNSQQRPRLRIALRDADGHMHHPIRYGDKAHCSAP